MQRMVKYFLSSYFIIVANALLCMAVYCTIFEWEESFHIKVLWQLIAVAFCCTFTLFIHHSKKELSKKQMKTRIIIHFCVIVALLLFFAFIFGWVNFSNKLSIVVFAMLVGASYFAVLFSINLLDVKTAKKMNKKLKEFQEKSK